MKRFLLPMWAVGVAACIQGGLLAGGIVINGTPSLPEGFYRRQACPVERGCFILFRLPASPLSARSYARERLIKQVVAVEGDRVSIAAAGVTVNGRRLANSAQLPVDRAGEPLPGLVVTEHVLGKDELLTMSTYNARSFDSRYFGVVPRGCVVAVVAPVLTW